MIYLCLGIVTRDWRNNIYYKSFERFNREIRKCTKTRIIFPTDESLKKLLYLYIIDIIKNGFHQDKTDLLH